MNNSANPDAYPSEPIVIVDDETQALMGAEMSLRAGGITNIVTCEDARQVIPSLQKHGAEVVLLDMIMPHISGEELLESIKHDFPEIAVIIITGMNEIESAVKCIKLGADDYMVKPVEKNRLISGVRKAIELRELQRENSLLRERMLSNGHLEHPDEFRDIISANSKMLSVFRYCEAIACTAQPVLITGETGVGKELVAKAIHALSKREGEFVAVNVAGVDDNVFADTLFGHKKGAYTGASEMRGGMTERAASGTLFLDEIGDLSQSSQVKLLRLIQEKEYFPLGSDVAQRSSARIIAATHRDVKSLYESESFRSDLFYRLHTHHIHIPPLRERKEDLPLLVDHFLNKAATILGKPKPTPPAEIYDLLSTYHFPGNIRELESMVFDAVGKHTAKKLSMETFKARMDIPSNTSKFSVPLQQNTTTQLLSFYDKLPSIKQAETLLISEAVKRAKGNQSIAAGLLGITRQALNQRLKRSG